MLEVKKGKTFRLGLLYERYKKRLFGFFFQMNRDVNLSEDLVQNVFIRILKYKHTYKEESKFVTWIFQIARNVNYDDYKKNKKNRHQKNIDEIKDNITMSETIKLEIAKNENIPTLQLALNQLSSEKKELLMLSKFNELKYKEIGEIIGCSEGAARTKVHRALNELRKKYLILSKMKSSA
jgi:RNA polymerase sigma-70 factor (ECF subfamily)